MAFTAAIKFLPQLDPSIFVIQDVSPYASPDSKSNFTNRTLTILDSNNNPLSGYTNPIPFPYAGGDSITIKGLTQDYALQIIMTLTPIVVNTGSVYTAEADVATEGYLQQGLYNIQVQRLNTPYPSSQADKIYRTQSIDLIIEGNNAQTGISYANFTGAQLALTRAQNIINKAAL